MAGGRTKRPPKPSELPPCQYDSHRRQGLDWRLKIGTDHKPTPKNARWICGVCHAPPKPFVDADAIERRGAQ